MSQEQSPSSAAAKPNANSLKTLERGIDVLELLARDGPMSNARVAAALSMHRSITYRLLRTLEERKFARRDVHGRYELGPGLAALGRAVCQDLQSAALPELTELADATSCTAFVVVRDQDEAVTLVSVQPRQADGHVIVYRPSARHPLASGAPGLAILASLPARADERLQTTRARDVGYVRTTGEIIPGLSALAAPLYLADGSGAGIAIVFVAGHLDEGHAIKRLVTAATRISAAASRV